MENTRLLIFAVIFIFIAFLNKKVRAISEERMKPSDFTIRRSIVFGVLNIMGTILFGYIFVLSIRADLSLWSQFITLFITLAILIVSIGHLSWKLQVKDEHFYFNSAFRRSSDFSLRDIDSISYTYDDSPSARIYSSRYIRTKHIVLYSGEKVLVKVNSAKTGFDNLLHYLQEKNLLDGEHAFDHHVAVVWDANGVVQTSSSSDEPLEATEEVTKVSNPMEELLAVNDDHEIRKLYDTDVEGHLVKSILTLFKDYKEENLYLFGKVPLDRLKHAGVSSPEMLRFGEKIILFYEDVMWKFTSGILLTTNQLYLKEAGARAKSTPLSDIDSISFEQGKVLLKITVQLHANKNIVFNVDPEKNVNHQVEHFVDRLNLTIPLLKKKTF